MELSASSSSTLSASTLSANSLSAWTSSGAPRVGGGPDGRGVGFYFRNTTEIVLFGVRGRLRTLAAGRTQVNIIKTRKREHSRKPEELYNIIAACSPGPFLELFARGQRANWDQWGNEVADYTPSWPTYANHSQQ